MFFAQEALQYSCRLSNGTAACESLKKGDAACTLYKSLYSEANWSHILGHIISLLDDLAMHYVGLCLFSLTIVRIVSNHKDIGLLESPLKIQTSEP